MFGVGSGRVRAGAKLVFALRAITRIAPEDDEGEYRGSGRVRPWPASASGVDY